METYTLRGIQSMLGISRAVINGLMACGFVTPSRGKRREYRFTFQDVVLLRTAYSLQAAHMPPRKILRSLQRLKAELPSELPLTGLRIAAVGNEIAVKEGNAQWHVESGQLLFDFEVKPASGTVSFLTTTGALANDEPGDWLERGIRCEAVDKTEAEVAYREAIRNAPDGVDAYLNLGVMLCELGRHTDAIELYREALRHCPHEALLHFNLGVALEDIDRTAEALASYEDCMQVQPKFADAHYNAARLHELLGHSHQAIRHYSEYRRLQRL